MKVISISVGILMFVFVILMTIRMSGLNQTYVPFDTAYFHGQLPYGIVAWEQNFLLEKNPDLILWVDVYRDRKDQILVKPWAERNQQKVDLDLPTSPTRPLLKDLLLKFPKTRFVINCNDNVQDIHLNLSQVIDDAKADDHVMIQSNYDTILISLKALKPRLVYGSTPEDLTRIKTFQSLWILPAAPLKGDVYFTGLKYRGVEAINADIAQEIHRRQKKLFIGPLSTKDEVDQALRLGADALFVSDPFLLPTH